MMAKSSSLPAEFQDEVVQIISELGLSGYIRLLIDYPVRLDEARLSIALRRLLDAEPVLGCRFVLEQGKPVWQRRDDLDQIANCPVAVGEDVDGITAPLLAERFVPYNSPNLSAVLIRSSSQPGDRLLLRVSHGVADGTAALDVAIALADLYTRLGGDPEYRPAPNDASRDSFLWMKNFKLRDRLELLLHDLKYLPAAFGPRRGLVADAETFLAHIETLEPAYQTLRFDAHRLAELDRYAHEHQATLNDIFLAAFFRAFDAFCPYPAEARLELVMPTNLRRYAPLQRRPAIRNLAGTTYIRLAAGLGATFTDTLAKIRRETLRHKQRLLGTEGQLATLWLARASFASKQKLIHRQILRDLKRPAPPVLTNLGHVQAHKLSCDGTAPTGLAIYGEASPAPVFLSALVRMDDSLSFTVSYDRRLGAGRVDAFIKRLGVCLTLTA